MAGIIRWKDLQNINTTELEINYLAGLLITASQINKLAGFTGTGADLNIAIGTGALISAHASKSLVDAHIIEAGTIKGSALVNSSVSKEKLSFIPLGLNDKESFESSIEGLDVRLSEAQNQINNLHTIAFPNATKSITDQITYLFSHIEDPKDAHDATAISYGNDFPLLLDCLTGANQAKVGTSFIKEFRIGDEVEIRDIDSDVDEFSERRVLTGVNYNTGDIGWTGPLESSRLARSYYTSKSATIKNLATADVQSTLIRSLRNSTDTFNGRLTINQSSPNETLASSPNDALVINNTGSGYTALFNKFSGKTNENFSIELGGSDGSSLFNILNSDKRVAAQINDDGSIWANTIGLEDRSTLSDGLINKQSLTGDRTWTLPDRSGFIGIGDLSFTEVLKVSLVPGTKEIKINPGYTTDYSGQKIGAWISMDDISSYAGGSINLETRAFAAGQLSNLGSKWQVVVVAITEQDDLHFFYSDSNNIKSIAITTYMNTVPSAFMKLAKIVFQGDDSGGIRQSSIEILEDQRPFLTMGMSSSYYEETVTSETGWDTGAYINLPVNSRAGGIAQTYKPHRGQLEVYLDGVLQEAELPVDPDVTSVQLKKDYKETSGKPAQIRLLKNIAPNSTLKFRITFAAAAVGGGVVETASLNAAYQVGYYIDINNEPVTLSSSSPSIDTLMSVDGSISVTNKIRNLKSLIFQPAELTSDTDKNQLYVNNSSQLIYHQYKTGTSTSFNILEEIESAKTISRIKVFNSTGFPIPEGSALAIGDESNHVVLCDPANPLFSRCIGVSLEEIGTRQEGYAGTSGTFKNSLLTIPHGSTVVVNPRIPGQIVKKTSVSFLPNDEYVEIGTINGGSLIINIMSTPKVKQVWKTEIAGEHFSANQTRLVRFAVSGEDKGRVYKAEKALANIDQKFWVVAAVQPEIDTPAGSPIELLEMVELNSSEAPFEDQDMGKPLYLGANGSFGPWRMLIADNAFTVGDAYVKIGIIEDSRKFIVDSVQVMGTSPG